MAKEIEKKFLVKKNIDVQSLGETTKITQGYLSSNKQRAVRVRIRDNKGYITVKGIGDSTGTSRFEFEKEIDKEDAKELLKLCEKPLLSKTRTVVEFKNHTFEIDKFLLENEGLVVAEVELSNKDEKFEKPSWLGKEVTGDVKYYNAMLIKNPYKYWKKDKKIIPRAEFRIFGQNIIENIKPKIWQNNATLKGIRNSEEIYIVSKNSDDINLKIRAKLLDMKIKIKTTKEGYQFFKPYKKISFPIKKEQLKDIIKKLNVKIKLKKESYNLEDFLTLIQSNENLKKVDAKKNRYIFSIDDVICEYAEILFNSAKIQSICCESEDIKKVTKIIKLLEIDKYKNTNYIDAIKNIICMKNRKEKV